MHGGRESVIRALTHIDMVVRMHGVLGADLTPQYLNSAIGDNFIGIHIGLGPRAGLPDGQREIIIPLTFRHFRGRLNDGTRPFRIKIAKRFIGQGGRAFDNTECPNDGGWHGFLADGKIHQ